MIPTIELPMIIESTPLGSQFYCSLAKQLDMKIQIDLLFQKALLLAIIEYAIVQNKFIDILYVSGAGTILCSIYCDLRSTPIFLFALFPMLQSKQMRLAHECYLTLNFFFLYLFFSHHNNLIFKQCTQTLSNSQFFIFVPVTV